MKNLTHQRLATLAAALALTALLAACGGGGGTSPAAVTTYTSATTCAGGATLTSTVSQATANALVPASCPAITAVQLAAVTVTRAAAAPNTIAVSGLPTNWTLTGGTATFTPIAPTTGAAVTGSISATGVITPSSTLPAGTTASSYAVAANLTFANAPATAVSSTIVVPAVPPTCAAPNVVNSTTNVCVQAPAATGYTFNPSLGGGGAFVADIGVLVTGANTLPAACVTVGDACWVQSVQNGTIKFVNSGAVMTGINARPIVFAFYVTSGGVYNTKAIYGDDGVQAGTAAVSGGGNTVAYFDIKGASTGALFTQQQYGCFLTYFNGGGFAAASSVCPI